MSLEPGASASDIARSAGRDVSQLFRWRKQLCERIAPEEPALLPVVVEPLKDETAVSSSSAPARKRAGRRRCRVEIELASGDRVWLEGGVDGDALREILAALRAR